MQDIFYMAFFPVSILCALAFFYCAHLVIVCMSARHESVWVRLGRPTIAMSSIDKWGIFLDFILNKEYLVLDDEYLNNRASAARVLYRLGYFSALLGVVLQFIYVFYSG
jgi:hypothetical protein